MKLHMPTHRKTVYSSGSKELKLILECEVGFLPSLGNSLAHSKLISIERFWYVSFLKQVQFPKISQSDKTGPAIECYN